MNIFSDQKIPRSHLSHYLMRTREWVALIDRELKHRTIAEPLGGYIFAADFDIIYDYVNDLPELGYQIINQLLFLPDVSFTLLPGTLHELSHFLAHQALPLPIINSTEDLLQYVSRFRSPCESTDTTQQTLRSALQNVYSHARQSRTVAERCFQIISSAHLVDPSERPTALGKPDAFRNLYRQLYSLLQVRRPDPDRDRPNQVDSLNLALTIQAASDGALFPLVTKSTIVSGVYATCRKQHLVQLPDFDLVMSPSTALFALGLRKAIPGQLVDLKSDFVTLETQLTKITAKDFSDVWLPDHTSQLLEQVGEKIGVVKSLIANIKSFSLQMGSAWDNTLSDVPEDVDLRRLSEISLRAINSARSIIRELLSKSSKLFEHAGQLVEPIVENDSELSQFNSMLKTAASASNGKLIIEKIIFVSKGGQVNDYNINQEGCDLVAITDSFKTQITQVSELLGQNAESYLAEFLKSIGNSDLPEDERAEILNTASEVVADVEKNGSLTNRARILWHGIRQLISEIPKAVKAWESVTELFGL